MTPLHIEQNTSHKIPLAADESLGTDLEQHLMPATSHSLKAGSLLGQLSLAMGRVV